MTLLPRRIFPRLAVLLLLSIGLSQIVNLHEALETEHRVHKSLVRSQIFEQVEAALRLLDDTSPEQQARVLDRLSLYELCYSLSPTAEVLSNEEEEEKLVRRFRNLLRLHSSGTPRLELSDQPGHACDAYIPVSGVPFDQYPDHDHDFNGLSLSVPMTDGRWLNAHARLVVPSIWDSTPVVSILVMMVACTLVVFIVVSHETKSLRRLAAAVERLGRGQPAPQVPESGPSEVVALIRAFNVMQDRITRFIQDRTRLLAAISHDLRTPLTSLRLKAELLEDDEIGQQMAATIDEMTAIVQSTLDFARSDLAIEESREIELSSLVDSLAEDLVELGLEVTFADSPRIKLQCRPTALRRAVRNLIENAVRYGERARVHCLQTNGFAVIVIEDDGPGIPKEQMAEVVKPFVRLEASRNSATGGVGLGLAIANDIVVAHGGHLEMQNLSKGLRVSVHLPLPA